MSRRVLVVDDSTFICLAVATALRDAGYDVDIATDLWAFEDGDGKKAPDLVIMDVVLQEAYGDEIAELLRATRGLSCPILLFSALPESELADRAKDAGLDGYITKRQGMPALIARVNELLGGKKPAQVSDDALATFKIVARQRVRRVVHVLAQAAQWSAAAIAAEMQALAGDADLVGATEIANAARSCREAVINQGSAGWTPVIGASISALTTLVDDKQPRARKLLVIEDRDQSRELVPLFDAAGHVVFEARTLAEARQKLRTTDYDAIVLDLAVDRGSGAELISEIRARMPATKLAVVGGENKAADAAIARELGTSKIAERVMSLLS